VPGWQWHAVADPLTVFWPQSSRDPKMIQELSQAAARATRQGWLGSTLCAFASLSLSLIPFALILWATLTGESLDERKSPKRWPAGDDVRLAWLNG
jgi:hypothetical protein